jgi:hypothetical protein
MNSEHKHIEHDFATLKIVNKLHIVPAKVSQRQFNLFIKKCKWLYGKT